jgi:hypothetical protein
MTALAGVSRQIRATEAAAGRHGEARIGFSSLLRVSSAKKMKTLAAAEK